ncbi:MAG: methyltransferase domain-containing protein [Oscillospiraceae bacterium]|jgi:ubiquinone/menaquinone biosynthesis C-methylase UbiE|nr:methyltransferase domain-containing protein [Oscillospiraceae bacterium]
MTDRQYKTLTIHEFDQAAEKFDDSSPSVYNMCRKDYPNLAAELAEEPFRRVLDAGCGTGSMLFFLKQKYPDKQYAGIDLSPKMVEVAKRKGLKHIFAGDCEMLPFARNSFDTVLCSMSFHHYPHPQAFFDSVFRVLCPGGRLILRDMTTGFVPMQWVWNHVELPLFNLFLHTGDVHVYNEKEIAGLCRNSGMILERFEQREGFRLHCVCRKPLP